MPLYERKTKEKGATPQRRRTFPGSATDSRMRASKDWELVDESKTSSTTAKGDERTGTGTATVTTGANGGS